ncbi:unnamed protein product [Penicillium pancosmium]
MLERGRFISRKAKVQKYQDDIIRVRTRLNALSDQFQSSIILEKVHKQSEVLENYRTTIESQKVLLRRIMNTLHLDAMEEPPRESAAQASQNNLTSDPDSSSDGLAIRPPTQWDPPGPQTP